MAVKIIISAIVFLLYMQTGLFMLWKNPSSRPHQWFFAISVYLAVLTIVFSFYLASGVDGMVFSFLLPASWVLLPIMIFRFHTLIAALPAGKKTQRIISAGFLFAGLLLLVALLLSGVAWDGKTVPEGNIVALAHPLFLTLVIASIAAAIFQFKRWCRKIPRQIEKKRFAVILNVLTAFYFLTWFLYVLMPDSPTLNVMLLPYLYLLPWYSAITFGFARTISSPGDATHTGNNLFQNLQQIVFICNKDSVVVQTNQFSIGLLGKRMDEVVGLNVAGLFAGHDQIRNLIESAHNSGHSKAKEMHLLAEGNHTIPVSVSCILLIDRFNDLFGFAVYGQDYREVIKLRYEIKQRRLTEAELRKMSENLESEAEKRTGEMRRSVEQLQLIIADRMRDEEALKLEIGEMEVMFNEIYTRVTKNIGIILTILDSTGNLGLGAIDRSEKKRLDRLFQRIDSVLLVNKQLMTHDAYGMVDFKQFLEMLIKRFNAASGDELHPEIILKAGGELLWIDQAVPLALVANELLSNAVIYAFEKRTTPKPTVWIEYSHVADSWCHFLVKDNGCGLLPGKPARQHELSGLGLVEMLVRDQLNGSMQITNEQGLSVFIRIPLNELRQGHIGILR